MDTETTTVTVTFGQFIMGMLGVAGFWTFLTRILDSWDKKREHKWKKDDKDTSQEKAIEKLNSTAEEHTAQLTNLQSGLMLLIYDRFEHLAERYIANNKITMKQLSVVSSLHETYILLGGDGWCKTLMDRIRELPIEEDGK